MASKNTHWNEATRVQMPALVHLTRIGYSYFGKISEDKKDAYFEQTVMREITAGMNALGFSNSREDKVFIQSRIAKQYLAQYNESYPAA